jgi:uncharacterized membrane-anchored protein YhcB (DUF1043 family)
MEFGFTPNQWLIVGLVLLFGLLIGAALAAGGGRKHKTRYKEESHRRAELERENDRLRKELKHAEIDTVSARARAPVDRT